MYMILNNINKTCILDRVQEAKLGCLMVFKLDTLHALYGRQMRAYH